MDIMRLSLQTAFLSIVGVGYNLDEQNRGAGSAAVS
jgi:hypothetical protein